MNAFERMHRTLHADRNLSRPAVYQPDDGSPPWDMRVILELESDRMPTARATAVVSEMPLPARRKGRLLVDDITYTVQRWEQPDAWSVALILSKR